jgi:hypothetical protein
MKITSLLLSIILISPTFAKSIKFSKVEFDEAGVPSKICYIYSGSLIHGEDYPSVAVFDGTVLNFKGAVPVIERKGDDFKMAFTIDVRDYPELLGRFDEDDWTLSVSGKLKSEKIAGLQFVTVLTIKGVKIGFVLPKAEQAGAGQPATRPEPKSEGGDKSQPEAEGRSR